MKELRQRVRRVPSLFWVDDVCVAVNESNLEVEFRVYVDASKARRLRLVVLHVYRSCRSWFHNKGEGFGHRVAQSVRYGYLHCVSVGNCAVECKVR